MGEQVVPRRKQNLSAPPEIQLAPNAKRFARAVRGRANIERRVDFDLADFFERGRAVNFDFLSCLYNETLRHDRPPSLSNYCSYAFATILKFTTTSSFTFTVPPAAENGLIP